MQKIKFLLGLFLLISLKTYAQPAMPEEGYRWVLNDTLSDEFNDTTLNAEKWKNTDPSHWIGRPPGLFTKEAVSVGDGAMRITTDKLPEPQVINGNTFTYQGGHVVSQNKVEPGSFIECRMKANKTFMSSTFWLIDYGNENTGCDKRTTEMDIQECIGYPDSKSQTQRMGSNTHSRNIPSGCTQAAGSRGNNVATPTKVYNDYYVYGAWWKSPTEILFYLNGQYQYTLVPCADFDLGMHIKLVCETYDWNPAPTNGGMTGTWDERTTFYDWVRTYNYLSVDEKYNGTDNHFSEEVKFSYKPSSINADNLIFTVNYKANSNKRLVLQLEDESGTVVATTEKTVYAGYANLVMQITNEIPGGSYKAVVSINNTSDDKLIGTESYSLTVNAVSTSINNKSDHEIYLSPNPVTRSFSVNGLKSPMKYEIYSVAGNQVKSGQTTETVANIDVSFFSLGTYIIFLKSNDLVKSFKFIKDK